MLSKAIKPTNPVCAPVAVSGVRTARSWWGTTNRSQCKHLTQRRMAWDGGEEAISARLRDLQRFNYTQEYYTIDSCLRNMDNDYGHKKPLNQAANEAKWGIVV